MANASGSTATRGARRTTRYNETVTLDRHALVQRMGARVIRAFESVGTILSLILVSDALLPLYFHEGPHAGELLPTSPVERAAYWSAYGFTLLEVLFRPNKILRTALRDPFVLGVVALAALSVGWSDDPSTSLRRAFALGMWTLFGYFLASRYTTTELLWHLGVALGLIALMSFVGIALAPDWTIESGFNGGAWRGVFTTKNVLGEMMLLAAVVFGVSATRSGRWRILSIIGLAMAVTLIAFAKATTALLIVSLLAVIVPFVLLSRRSRAASAIMLVGMLAVSAAGSVALAERETVLSVLGKDATLTGRTVLWSQVMQRIEERPVLGYGYGAFWESTSAESERLRVVVGWDTPHSHNGLLDIWLDFGFFGVLSLLAAYALSLWRAWTGLRTHIGIDGVWAMTFLIMLFLGNTTESSISQSLLIWVVFVAVACMRWEKYADTERVPEMVDAPIRERVIRVRARDGVVSL